MPPSLSEDKDEILPMSSGRWQRPEENPPEEEMRENEKKNKSPNKEKKEKKDKKKKKGEEAKEKKEKKQNKDKGEKNRWAPHNDAARSGWLPTPSPITLTMLSTEQLPTQEPTSAPTEEPTLEPSAAPVTLAPTTATPTSAAPTTSPSLFPTWSPTKLLASERVDVPPCPPEYDPSYTGYTAGDTVEMSSHIFVCQSGPYEAYCSIGEMDSTWNETVQEWWQESWYHVEACEVIQAMTSGETTAAETTTSPAAGRNTPADTVLSPDALYDDEDWGDLPEEIQNAMAALGYTEEIWNKGSKASTDDLDWEELSDEEQAAALVIGFTEKLWMSQEEEAALKSTDTEAQVAAEKAQALDTTATADAAVISKEALIITTQMPINTTTMATMMTMTTAMMPSTTHITTTEATTTKATTNDATRTEATTTKPPATTTTSTSISTTTEATMKDVTPFPSSLVIETEPNIADAISNVPTSYPTYMPTQSWPPCPPSFNPASTYTAGEFAEVGGHTFQCNTAKNGAYVKYCNIPDWDNSLLEADENAKDMWEDAWVHIDPCTQGDGRH